MINYLMNGNSPVIAFIGVLTAFFATCLAIEKCEKFLPKDAGREFAVDGKQAKGKPRGAGFIFILVFMVSALLFAQISLEMIIYLVLIGAEMLTGFLDDASEKPWGELKKGILDLIVAVMAAVTYINHNSCQVEIATLGINFALPPVVFGILTVILVWASINVTNCADGVDGLSGTLTIITMMSIFGADVIRGKTGTFAYPILLFAVCVLGYLWYNAAPSRLLMGDAGSRAMGFAISIAVLKTGSPFLYIPFAFVLMMDGGLGLLKVSCIRYLKLHILNHVRTPLHDHVRKNMDWSGTQTVFRFAIIQIMISAAAFYFIFIQIMR